ncbi:hypothetical protein CYLTODRAFT_417984 [Cylindrobasidium torrendii FP15055 ss-10]|uniref:Uncharacterized protein n=1 Tax=Cylindrobasidium torrendii FP15055 ss-10 TaxID=1314674 RepID=A0A0D7BPP8_9AGAR|nr:hypothetical protein CYLTODRAFT_417984 [Cylindrobasidium torrendii FP15055 ss-10]
MSPSKTLRKNRPRIPAIQTPPTWPERNSVTFPNERVDSQDTLTPDREQPTSQYFGPGSGQPGLEGRASFRAATPSSYRTPIGISPRVVEDRDSKALSAVNLTYELPPLVETVKLGWTNVTRQMAIVSSALAICSVLLLTQAQAAAAARPVLDALFVFAYASILCNIGSALCSALVEQRLAAIPYESSKEGHNPPTAGWYHGTNRLLQRYGVGPSWTVLLWYWIITFHTGVASLFVQIGIQLWIQQQSLAGKIAVSCIIGLVAAPLGLLAMYSLGKNLRNGIPQAIV